MFKKPIKWIRYDGKGCPVKRDQKVEVRFSDGFTGGPAKAAYYDWDICGDQYDITYFRVVEADSDSKGNS